MMLSRCLIVVITMCIFPEAFAESLSKIFVEYRHESIHVSYTVNCKVSCTANCTGNSLCSLNAVSDQIPLSIQLTPKLEKGGMVSIATKVSENSNLVWSSNMLIKIGESSRIVSPGLNEEPVELTIRPLH